MQTFDFLEGKTILDTKPLMFTGVLDENVARYFTLYLLQDDEGIYVFAPSHISYNFPSDIKTHYGYLANNLVLKFEDLEEAKESFDTILNHVGEPLDLHDLDGGFMLTEFDMNEDLYKVKPKIMPKLAKCLVANIKSERILFHIVNVENRIIINKRMCLTYETHEKALATYMKIVPHFKDIEELKVATESDMNLTEVLNGLLLNYVGCMDALEFEKDMEGDFVVFNALIRFNNHNLRILFKIDEDLHRNPTVETWLRLIDNSTKIVHKNYSNETWEHDLAEHICNALEFMESKGTA